MSAQSKLSASVRDAQPDDASRISELGRTVFGSTFGHTVTPDQLQTYLNEAHSVDSVLSDMKDPAKSLVIAIQDGTDDILGFALLTRNSVEPCLKDYERTVEFQRIYVHPKAHGTGVAKLLYDDLEARARNEGFKNIWLGVWEENFRGQKAYAKWGFHKVGKHDFNVGGDIQTDNIMIKAL